MIFLKYLSRIAAAIGLAISLKADHEVEISKPQEVKVEQAVSDYNFYSLETCILDEEQQIAVIPENKCDFTIYSPSTESCDLVMGSPDCRLDDFTLALTRASITRRTLEELSSLVINNSSEKGGYNYIYKDRMRIYEAANENDGNIIAMEYLAKCLDSVIATRIYDLPCMGGETIHSKATFIINGAESHFNSGKCKIEQSDNGWKNKIEGIRTASRLAIDKNSPEYLKTAASIYAKSLGDTYKKGKTTSTDIIGYRSGNLHTQDNGAFYSNTDICIAKESDEKREFHYLNSHNLPNSIYFQLYVMCKEKQAKLGMYQILNECGEN